MFDDNAGRRALRIEFRDAFVGSVGVVDVVVGKLLALQLSRGRHAKAFSGRAIERRALMRVLAIAQRLDQFSAEGAIVRRVVVQRVREPVRDRGIVSRGPRIGLRRQFFPQLQRNHAAVARHLAEYFFVVGRIDNHGHVHVVFGGGADHCRAADVDVLDAVVVRSAFRDRGFEWIEVHHQEIDRLDVVLFHRGEVLFVPADREQSAMHFRMQRLDAPVHHFG